MARGHAANEPDGQQLWIDEKMDAIRRRKRLNMAPQSDPTLRA